MGKRWLSKIELFEPFFWIYFIWYYLPIARTFFKSALYNQIFFSFFICGCAICVIKSLIKRKRQKQWYLHFKNTALAPVVLYMLVFGVLVFLDVGTAERHIRISFTFWGVLIAYYLITPYERAQRRLTILIALMFLVTAFTSLLGVIANPRAARILTYAANDLQEDLVIRMLNIGGIAFFQGLVVCVPILISFIRRNQYRTICTALLITIFVSLLSASFTITLLMFMVAFLFGYLSENTSIKNAFIVSISAFLIFVIPWTDILSYLADIIGNETISARLDSIARSISMGAFSGNLASRFQTYITSLNTFLSNPFGIGPEYTYLTLQNGIGYHSQILDDLARYGFWALAFYIAFFVGYYKLVKKQWGQIEMQRIALPIVSTYLGFLFLNPGFTSEHESVLMLFLLPTFPALLTQKS